MSLIRFPRFAIPVAPVVVALLIAARGNAQTNTFPSSGNVGIGTTAPAYSLHIWSQSPTFLLRSSAPGYRGLWTSIDDTAGAIVFNSSYNNTGAYPFSFQIGSGEIVRFDASGRVGIGTALPNQMLSVAGNLSLGSSGSFIMMGNSAYTGGGGYLMLRSDGDNGRDFLVQNYSNATGWNSNLSVLGETGNVGIGTKTPGTKLDVAGTITAGKTYDGVLLVGPLSSAPAYVYINTKIPFSDLPAPRLEIKGYNYAAPNHSVRLTLSWYVYNNQFYWTQYKSEIGYYNPSRIRLGTYDDNGVRRVRIELANDGTYWASYSIAATDHDSPSSFYTGWNYGVGSMPADTADLATVSEYAGIVYSTSGNVGIGTTNPTQKLSVNGTVQAKEVIVQTGWSDYVFDSDYRLAPLSDVERHIKAEKHLPGIPSAKQVAEQGVSLGEMQAKLLAKIEELTLHQIAQEKKIAALEATVTRQALELAHIVDQDVATTTRNSR